MKKQTSFFSIKLLASVITALIFTSTLFAQNNKLKIPAQENEKTPLLGVGGGSVSKALRYQLGLKPDEGLSIYHVVPDSPAELAGIREHDIIVRFQNKKIKSQDALRNAVLAQKPGDEVSVTFIRRGERKTKKIILAESAHAMSTRPKNQRHEWLRNRLGSVPDEDISRIQKLMERRMREMQERFMNEDMMPEELRKFFHFNNNDKGGRLGMYFGASATITDEEGTITLKNENQKKEIVVKNKKGEIIFQGPYESEQDKAKVPEQIRERVEKLKLEILNPKRPKRI